MVEVGERFFSKITVDSHNGCWLWNSALTRGYGVFSVNGHTKYAHLELQRLRRAKQ